MDIQEMLDLMAAVEAKTGKLEKEAERSREDLREIRHDIAKQMDGRPFVDRDGQVWFCLGVGPCAIGKAITAGG